MPQTKTQKLRQLANYLLTLDDPTNFDMAVYNTEEDGGQLCGAAACVIGHGPDAGIPRRAEDSWDEYAHRNFLYAGKSGARWWWCFAAEWSKHDNTSRGAALRILYCLIYGVPDWFDPLDLVDPDYALPKQYKTEVLSVLVPGVKPKRSNAGRGRLETRSVSDTQYIGSEEAANYSVEEKLQWQSQRRGIDLQSFPEDGLDWSERLWLDRHREMTDELSRHRPDELPNRVDTGLCDIENPCKNCDWCGGIEY